MSEVFHHSKDCAPPSKKIAYQLTCCSTKSTSPISSISDDRPLMHSGHCARGRQAGWFSVLTQRGNEYFLYKALISLSMPLYVRQGPFLWWVNSKQHVIPKVTFTGHPDNVQVVNDTLKKPCTGIHRRLHYQKYTSSPFLSNLYQSTRFQKE